ncbi:MAG TPA: alpha/beta hydrolase [Verrucomicrobiae bacterium]|nr:alpha/beta hydrolase [Verrucomicrobiae bacterium]
MKITLCRALCVAMLAAAGCSTSHERSSGAPGDRAAKSRFAQYGTNKVHYVVEGTGRHTLVLVHCWSGNLGFWREQAPVLAKEAKLVLIDLPGHGQSDKPHTAYTMDFLAGAVLAVMDDAHVKRATLVGHSMGAPVICRVYHQAPQRVAALVSVDGLLRRPDMPADQASQFVNQFTGEDYREKTRVGMGALFAPGKEAVRDRVISEMLQTPQYVMVSAMKGMFNSDQPDWDPKHADVPVLALNAPNPMWTDEYQKYVASLSSQTDYRTIPGTGHWLMLEKPSEFNTNLTEMLKRFDLIGP